MGERSSANDESFKINSPVTVQARKISRGALLEWYLRNKNDDKLNSFSRQLLQSLKQVILLKLSRTFTVKRNYGKDSFN